MLKVLAFALALSVAPAVAQEQCVALETLVENGASIGAEQQVLEGREAIEIYSSRLGMQVPPQSTATRAIFFTKNDVTLAALIESDGQVCYAVHVPAAAHTLALAAAKVGS